MAYESLRKLYYGDKEDYKKTYKARFDSEWTTKIDFSIAGMPAFFVASNEVAELMFNILRLDKEISRLCSFLPGKALQQYSRKCLIDEIVITNDIEGVYSSRKEIGAALTVLEEQSAKKKRAPRFLGMVNKYNKLLRNEKVSLSSCNDVRALYDELVLAEVVAENKNNLPDGRIFRKDQATVCSVTDRVIHSGLTPESAIIASLEKALAFLHDDTIDSMYRICLFHYLLEYIHPFYDGNGRLGRFIVSYYIAETMTPLLAYRISETIKENVKDYYEAFKICNDPHNMGDLTPFLLMMLGMIRDAAMELHESLDRKCISWERYENAASELPDGSSPHMRRLYSLLVQAALFGEQGITMKELMSNMNLSSGTIRKKLDFVNEHSLLLSVKDGKEKYYKMDLAALDKALFAAPEKHW